MMAGKSNYFRSLDFLDILAANIRIRIGLSESGVFSQKENIPYNTQAVFEWASMT